MIVAVFAFALLLHLLEASHEAQHGDRKHWTSITISFLVNNLFSFLIGFPFLEGIAAWCAVRAYFDLMYNYFKQNHWAYLGSSWTDGVLRRMNAYILFVFRILFSLLCILYVLWN